MLFTYAYKVSYNINMILYLYFKQYRISMHAKACEASRGHISRFPFDWAIHLRAGSAT